MPYKQINHGKRHRNMEEIRRSGATHCWICGYPVVFTKNDSAGIRASVDHVGDDELRLAHGWCNSRRGSAHAPLTPQMRLTCKNHMEDTYGKETLLKLGSVAQRLEQRTHNPPVLGSTPSGATTISKRIFEVGSRVRIASCSIMEYKRPTPLTE